MAAPVPEIMDIPSYCCLLHIYTSFDDDVLNIKLTALCFVSRRSCWKSRPKDCYAVFLLPEHYDLLYSCIMLCTTNVHAVLVLERNCSEWMAEHRSSIQCFIKTGRTVSRWDGIVPLSLARPITEPLSWASSLLHNLFSCSSMFSPCDISKPVFPSQYWLKHDSHVTSLATIYSRANTTHVFIFTTCFGRDAPSSGEAEYNTSNCKLLLNCNINYNKT
jgi:hypothetical protein